MRILFVRHAETHLNATGYVHVKGDPDELTENGYEQMRKLGQEIKGLEVEHIYHSAEQRSVQSAVELAKVIDVPCLELHDLHERDWGEWAGQEWANIAEKLEPMSTEERYTFVPPGGESWQQMEERIKGALNEITKSGFKTVAVVTHTGILRAIMPLLLGEDKSTSFGYSFANAQAVPFIFEDDKYRHVELADLR